VNNLNNHIAEETPPKANAMINTFRAFGYNLQTAIADIIDNSISAKAGTVWIDYAWEGAESWVSILDDGSGMNRDGLVEAMTPGSKDPNDERDENDLGRFGLGLKTSSFSQCKVLTVASKKEEHALIKRCWNLDHVNETGRWSLLDYISDDSYLEKLDRLKSGTLVLWQSLDRLVGNAHKENDAARMVFLEEFEAVEKHLGLVFHRYIDKRKIKIYINGALIQAWDPFMKEENASQLLHNEWINGQDINIKCYVLPHISSMNEEARKKARIDEWYALQGFYIYRNERLLLYGDWLGLFGKNEHYKNARILIDIPNKLDHEWKIDIKKATATPSVSIRKDLVRLGKSTRMTAANIYRFRGNQIILNAGIKSFDFQSVWKVIKTRDNNLDYIINEDHPVIKSIADSDSITKKDLKTILKLVTETLPIEAIIQNYSEDPMMFELRSENKDPDEATINLSRLMYQSLMISGVSHEMAVKQILHIEPFNEYPLLVEYLK
jgi:hypothetical protein